MIVLQISNSAEVMSSKVGSFLGRITPDSVELNAIEQVLIKKLAENLAAEGIRGVVASVRGLDLEDTTLVLQDTLHVRHHQAF